MGSLWITITDANDAIRRLLRRPRWDVGGHLPGRRPDPDSLLIRMSPGIGLCPEPECDWAYEGNEYAYLYALAKHRGEEHHDDH
jgi:hypothetical protein